MVRALAEALFSERGEVAPARLDAITADLDDWVSRASRTLRFGLLLMLDVLRWSPLVLGRASSLESLPIGDRVRHLERLERSPIRQLPLVVVAYKMLLALSFYEDEDEQRAIGYPGRERARWRLALVGGEPQ